MSGVSLSHKQQSGDTVYQFLILRGKTIFQTNKTIKSAIFRKTISRKIFSLVTNFELGLNFLLVFLKHDDVHELPMRENFVWREISESNKRQILRDLKRVKIEKLLVILYQLGILRFYCEDCNYLTIWEYKNCFHFYN